MGSLQEELEFPFIARCSLLLPGALVAVGFGCLVPALPAIGRAALSRIAEDGFILG